jgi:hypothetical protein
MGAMTTTGGPDPAIEALAVGSAERVGRYEYLVDTDSWSWSDTFCRILGLEPGVVVPSAGALAAHLRPEGTDSGVEAVTAAFTTGEPFSVCTRVTDGRGGHRTVLLSGHGLADDDGRVRRVLGYLVDLTDTRRRSSEVDVQEALSGALEHRAVIEQAKGVLMLAHGVDADQAFDLLRAYSQDKNIKVRDLADRVVELVAKDGEPDEGFLRKVLQILDAVG